METYEVIIEGGILIEDIDDMDKAVDIAIEKAKKITVENVEMDLGFMDCPVCQEPLDSVCVFGKKALVGLVFRTEIEAENQEKAESEAKDRIDIDDIKTLEINQK